MFAGKDRLTTAALHRSTNRSNSDNRRSSVNFGTAERDPYSQVDNAESRKSPKIRPNHTSANHDNETLDGENES